ncbi:hydrogenase maturation protein HypF [Plasticicumulans lactativorans]|uniref:Carbamoyltransferase HypF n=1 Tax=Plasticicumulans lactativorans TaxID=1133106 RepID=A0A4R2KU13_9GAMM|nr:carbamoyltransferase HypF [Plasticicumulans lactativorans]TCO76352.1 hydrogenase maturation protein HypF [Plasticicumulans lactativorans]
MSASDAPRRLALRVRGQVQGVGFRPFVWRLARDCRLSGWVRNDGAGVAIEVQGAAAALAAFRAGLATPPPLARIDTVEAAERPCEAAADEFHILASAAGPVRTGIGPDMAVCAACIAELCDPHARRWRYAFTTCTHCGPRYTVAARLPWDRANTALAGFPLCADCAAEYADPADRRFHAEPLACPACGPRLVLRDAAGRVLAADDPLAATLALLHDGRIVAVKGLGGFHLVCDARNAASVAALRARKHRPAKPFALLAANLASLAGVVRVDADAAALLQAPQRPVVLLERAPGAGLPGIAPGLDRYGVMLPATPLQVLLFHEAAGRPAGTAWLAAPQPLLLVCTSANPSGEPLVIDDDEAVARLAGSADAILGHDRAILQRVDDSVLLPRPGAPLLVRRARGWTPQALRLPAAGPAVLAFGGDLKNTVCATRGDTAVLSQHLGDLASASARRALADTVAHLLALLDLHPARVACDRYPDGIASRLAAAFAAGRGLPLVAVQHHHAHVAAVLAEHGHVGPALGLALDGFGWGADDTLWGGEWLRVDGAHSVRLGHLLPLALPGGDAAAREPWRMAASALHALGRGAEIVQRWAGRPAARTVAAMLAQGVRCPPTSSAGRWFDAAAGLLGVCETMSYEGEAAMRLEAAARRHGAVAPLAGGWRWCGDALDLRPLLAHLAAEADADRGAALFHATLAAALAEALVAAARAGGLATVAAAGGVCLNRELLAALRTHLDATGLALLEARALPPNDGGLALGQAWVAQQAALADA